MQTYERYCPMSARIVKHTLIRRAVKPEPSYVGSNEALDFCNEVLHPFLVVHHSRAKKALVLRYIKRSDSALTLCRHDCAHGDFGDECHAPVVG